MTSRSQLLFGVCEQLESRRLMAAVYPSAVEQYVVELINRARANPNAEVQRYARPAFNDLNEGISDPNDQITPEAKQPVAPNPYITDAARKHSQWMINTDVFSHTGVNGTNPGQRMSSAGYNWGGYGENIAWSGTTGAPYEPSTTVPKLHEDLFVDDGIEGRGHRINILDPGWREVGVGVVSGAFNSGPGTYNSVMLTTDFGYTQDAVFLTGVAYTDHLTDDNFYSVGEGLGNVTITATRASDGATFTTKTWQAGGYALALAPGTYTVVGSGPGLGGTITHSNVVIDSRNVKRDFSPRDMKAGGDYNKDGKQDVLWRDSTTGGVELWLMNGASLVQKQTIGTVADLSWRIVGGGDFNGDGKDDVLWRHASTGQLAIWAMNGTAVSAFSTAMQTVNNLDWNVVGTGRFNGDAHTDIVWRNNKTRGTLVWEMNGKGQAKSTTLPTVRFPDWVIGGTGDFTGDGKADLMWRNTATGQNLLWRMNGVAIGGVVTLNRVANSNWVINSVGDLDGNGSGDLLWRNASTGGSNAWLMNQTTLKQAVALPNG